MNETTENNKLIAEFMGVIDENNTLHCPDGMTITPYHDSEIRYDESWDWLMPVVEKIESIKGEDHYRYVVEISGGGCKILSGSDSQVITDIWGEEKQTAVYLAVLVFIKWYKNRIEIEGDISSDMDREADL